MRRVATALDTVQSSVSFSLADAVHAMGGIENLTLDGLHPLSTAPAMRSTTVIIGNSRQQYRSQGWLAADHLDGGAGIDTASYAASSAGGHRELDDGARQRRRRRKATRSFSIENLTGSTFDDTLEGDGGNNLLAAGA